MKKAIFITAVAIAALSSHNAAQAELIKDGIWKISAGDTIDSILQSVLPKDKHRHQRLKNLASRLNKTSFSADGQLIAGKTLRLPGAKMPEQAPANVPKIGRVLISNGQLAAKQKNGSRRSLTRGSSIYEGDTVETKAGRSQLRFSDGSLVALRPNTVFKVEEYNYAGQQDGSEKGVYNLLRGGFRTISGAIGKLNKQNYRVKTPVATIGIRGTHYGLTVCEGGSCKGDGLDDGLYGGVVDGSIVTQNRSGESTFNNDEYFSIASIDAKPVSLLAPPGIVFGQSKKEIKEAKKNGNKSNKTTNAPKTNKKRLTKKPGGLNTIAKLNKEQLNWANPKNQKPTQPPINPNNPDLPEPLKKPQRQGTKAPANARIHIGFLTKDMANPVTQQIEDNHVAFQLGQQNANSAEIGEIYTAQTPSGGDALTYLGFSSTESVPALGNVNLHREFFAPDANNLKDTGFSSANGLDISWGRWDNAFISTSVNASANAINLPTQGLHYIYSENDLASPGQLQGLSAGGALPSTITLNPSGGTNPTDLNGNVGSIVPAFTSMTLNLGGPAPSLAAYNIKATFATGETYALQLKDTLAVPLNSIIGPGNGIKLDGTCYNGGACPTNIPLSGNATADFLIGTGYTVNSISSYAVNDSESNATVGITGTLLLSGGGGG
jgi:hypothetical protein